MFFIKFLLSTILPFSPGLLVGTVLIYSALKLKHKAKQVQHWPTTSGRVLACSIAEKKARTRKFYRAIARYQYVVNAKTYESQRRFIGEDWSGTSRLEAEQQCLQYQPGTEVRVYYNPQQPEEAILEFNHNNVYGWMLGFGCFFLSMSLLIGSIILVSSLDTCGITPTSTQPRPGSPAWCRQTF